jgi:hypothetical protein
MKAKLVTMVVIDFENVGDDIKSIIENTRFPNRCISPTVLDIKTEDIGEWDDDHPLNKWNTFHAEIDRLFGNGKSVEDSVGIISQRDDFERLARDLYDSMKVLISEEMPKTYHDCVDNGTGMCAWCYAEEEMNKAAVVFGADESPSICR